VPDEAQSATPQGAADFGRFYWEAIGRAFKTLDTSQLEAVSSPECEVCQRYITSIQGIAAAGQRVEGNEITVTDAVAPDGESEVTQATVFFSATAGRVVAADGSVVVEEPARPQSVSSVELRRSGDSWLVVELVAP
jgi:hypothetical protein